MDKNVSESKKKFGVLDFFIILILVLCVAGIVIRLFMKYSAEADGSFGSADFGEYAVSYVSKNQRSFIPDYLAEGTEFRFRDTAVRFGTPVGKPLVQPAEVDVVTPDGTHKSIYNTSTDERTDRNDLRGTFIVRGKVNDEGVLLVEGSDAELVLNKDYEVESDLLVFGFTVTGISKAS